QQCADAERGREAAEAALQRVEAEMKQTHAKLQEELEAALLEANERIAEHDELLQQKLEEQGEYYEKLLEEKSRLEPVPADGAELGDALHWKAESDGLMEEAQPAEQPRRAAAASRNPFASMSVPSQQPDSLVDQGGDDDDVFGSGALQHPTVAGDVVSGERPAELKALVAELRGRLAEMEAGLSSATLARDGAMDEVKRLAQQCADAERGREAAEAALQRVEAEMKQTHAKLQEELEAALLEANERIAEHDELLQQKLEEQGEYYEKLLEEKSRLEPVPADGAELGDALHWKAESDGLMEEAQPAEQPRRAAAASRNPFASMSVPSQQPDSLVDQGGDDDDVFGSG
ncbi:hypothetical protein TraAM80_09140, partial [Trypanosoma rangeli]